jgi:hypothetical protein
VAATDYETYEEYAEGTSDEDHTSRREIVVRKAQGPLSVATRIAPSLAVVAASGYAYAGKLGSGRATAWFGAVLLAYGMGYNAGVAARDEGKTD